MRLGGRGAAAGLLQRTAGQVAAGLQGHLPRKAPAGVASGRALSGRARPSECDFSPRRRIRGTAGLLYVKSVFFSEVLWGKGWRGVGRDGGPAGARTLPPESVFITLRPQKFVLLGEKTAAPHPPPKKNTLFIVLSGPARTVLFYCTSGVTFLRDPGLLGPQ